MVLFLCEVKVAGNSIKIIDLDRNLSLHNRYSLRRWGEKNTPKNPEAIVINGIWCLTRESSNVALRFTPHAILRH